jgi:predicted nucleotidyltransferase component of viral defense system
MIEKRQVQKIAQLWQTTTDNVAREYFQQLFLSRLYQEHGSDSMLFKGGTALRIIWQSPRFSEDLDFTGTNITIRGIETLMEETLTKIETEGVQSKPALRAARRGIFMTFILSFAAAWPLKKHLSRIGN